MRTDPIVGGSLAQSQQQTREAIREQVRQSIEQVRVDAVRAREEARALAQGGGGTGIPQAPPAPPAPPVPGVSVQGERVIVTQDGRVIEVDPDGGVMIDGEPISVVVPEQDFPFGPGGPHIPIEAVVITIAFFVMIVLVAVGIPIARAFGRRIDKRTAAAPQLAELAQRLEGIEQAIETVAVEVERISEGQRYSARLMTEMQQAQRIPAGGNDR